jgi:hypothetical protein
MTSSPNISSVFDLFPSLFHKRDDIVESNEDLQEIFNIFQKCDKRNLFCHCVIACNESHFFLYISNISSIFVRKVKDKIVAIFPKANIEQPPETTVIEYIKSRSKNRIDVLSTVKKKIKRSPFLLSFHWLILQLDINSIHECLHTANFPLDDTSKVSLCELILKEYIVARNHGLTTARYRDFSIAKKVIINEVMKKRLLEYQNGFTKGIIIADSRVRDDDDER